MNKAYMIKLRGEIIGKTNFEKADPPMGVVFGEIIDSDKVVNYEFIKAFCQVNNIELVEDYPRDELISTRTIEQLEIISPEGLIIKGLGNQISGMNSEGFEVMIEGISYPFYEEEFPNHEVI